MRAAVRVSVGVRVSSSLEKMASAVSVGAIGVGWSLCRGAGEGQLTFAAVLLPSHSVTAAAGAWDEILELINCRTAVLL